MPRLLRVSASLAKKSVDGQDKAGHHGHEFGVWCTWTLCPRRRRVYHEHIMGRPIRILGIDPGLRRTGWGLIEVDGNRLVYTACGSVATNDRGSLAERLVMLHDGLAKVVDDF